MRKLTNNLDERQEKQLLHIEKNGCWFAFWALIASIFIQEKIFGINNVKALAGEYIVFFSLAIYLTIGCIKNGIWDRHLKANPKTNMITSLIAAVLAPIAFIFVNYGKFKENVSVITVFAVMAISVFIICFLLLSLLSMLYKKQAEKLENQYEEEVEKN